MAADFVTKRPHKKSRGGCQTCKLRKVKCNESQPKCSFCEKRNLSCLYINKPARSGSPTEISSSSNFASGASTSPSTPPSNCEEIDDVPAFWNLVTAPKPAINTSLRRLSTTDLQLMYHWSTVTWNTIAIDPPVGPGAASVLLVNVPQLAFENDYLLNCMLGIASIHKEHLGPLSVSEVHRKQTAVYRVRALNGFREALARNDGQSLNWDAALMMSVMLLALCSNSHREGEEDLTVLNWLVLYRGLGAVIMLKNYERIYETTVWPVFRREFTRLSEAPVVPTILISLFQGVGASDPDFVFLEQYCTAVDSLGILYASLRQDGVSPCLFVRIVCWPTFTSQEFTNCAREIRPRALVILAHFLVFIKLIKGLWWLEGTADFDIAAISKMIGPTWSSYIAVPLEALTISDKDEIARLLLR